MGDSLLIWGVGMKRRNILFSIIFVLSSIILFLNVFTFRFSEDKIIEIKLDDQQVIIEDIPNVDLTDEKDIIITTNTYITVKNSTVYKNDNYRGMLSISNTSFNEPIYQYSDNDYYLTHDSLGRKKSSGATFLDYRVDVSSNKVLIYGHNNNSLTLPFSILENYNYYEYYQEHKYIILNVDGKNYKYLIFSVYVETDDWDYMKINFSNNNSWFEHLRELKNKSFYDTGVDVSSSDKILILQTCSKNKDYSSYSKKYMLVIGKLVEE